MDYQLCYFKELYDYYLTIIRGAFGQLVKVEIFKDYIVYVYILKTLNGHLISTENNDYRTLHY